VGTPAADLLVGRAGDDRIDGRAGADTMIGGRGDDTYVVDHTGDVVLEKPGQGLDVVYASATYALSANVENLVLVGTAAIDGYGNDLANTLQGNAAANTLAGGAGNDSYIVDHPRDVVIENAGEGRDTVYSSITYALGANVEDLMLTGTAASDGLGNALDNRITGNGGNNVLNGGIGNDRLDGAAGADVLIGGVGDDIYVLNRGSGADLAVEWGGSAGDVAQFGSDIAADQLWFSRVGASLVVQVIGTSDSLTVKNWYAVGPQRGLGLFARAMLSPEEIRADYLVNWFGSGARRIDWFKTGDGKVLQEAQVQNLVDAMAAFAPPPAGQTALSPEYQAVLMPTLAANWQ
jgi:Ca2+-binding RTX toxin-like protein